MHLTPSNGPLSSADIDRLSYIARQQAKDGAVFVDIGSFEGLSASILCDALDGYDNWTVHLVDDFVGGQSGCTGSLPKLETNLRSLGYLDRCVLHALDSTVAARDLADESVDLVFIDANHSYSKVKADICAYMSKLRRGGLLCGHDYDRKYKHWTTGLATSVESLKEEDCPPVPFTGELHPNYTLAQVEIDLGSICIHTGVAYALHELFGDDFGFYGPFYNGCYCCIWYTAKK